MLWGLAAVLIILWLIGFLVIPIGGALIHLLLIRFLRGFPPICRG
jgi:hypothetical protein